jgi:RimJ/RimL family protein N-acetyltransferase
VTVEGFSLSETRSFLQTIETRGWPCTVAVADDAVIGWCDIIPRPAQGFTHVGTLGAGVAQEWRGQGIGRRLLVDCLAQAREIRLERIELVVYSDNPRAMRLYESLGFQHEGRKVQARKLDGYHQDELLMALRFQGAL